VDRLAGADQAALTLVSAPAGFGKTTLVADWLADHPAPAWVSLDRRDDDPARFWAYVAAAIGAETALADAGDRSPDEVVTTLLNVLDARTEELVLVLDDYHAIESPAIHEQVSYLVQHLPAHARVVVTTRSDPPLPLPALRARGELLEVRAADLRFTDDEAAGYLEGSMGLALGPTQVAALGERTEGWIAALQLAGLSMQGRDDVAGFIDGFAGDDRFVVDYLADEVLDRQDGEVRSFLLRTSILGTLSGPICDAVVEGTGSLELLRRLDRANLFLVALDDRRVAYRYHHLFADVLHARLLDEQPDLVDELHRRACEWCADHGELVDAVGHALAGGHVERAAELVERAAPELRRDRQEAMLRRWLESLPPELFQSRPVLTVTLVGARMATGDQAGVAALLDVAEAALEGQRPIAVDEEELADLPAQIAVYRAGLALLAGDTDGTIRHAERVLALVDGDDHLRRGSASALLGLAHWRSGDLAVATERYADSVEHLSAAGHHADALGCSLALADLALEQGRLADAAAVLAAGLRTAAQHPRLRGAADMHVALAEVAIERGELDAATDHLDAAAELGDAAGLPQNPYRRRVAHARLAQAQGDLD
jgi:LuxR family maltose regulon positive regulatory protein